MSTATATASLPTLGPYLIDTFPVKLTLVEGAEEKKGRTFLRGLFGRVGTPTNNGRVYPELIMKRELKRLDEDLERRRCFGELDHPADGRTRLQRVSHLITSLEINEKGEIIGEAEILDTEQGRNLKAIIAAGAEVGVSSRGLGTTESDTNGNKVVREDYRLMTFDIVAEPATPGAFPKVFVEGVGDVDPKTMTSEQVRKAFPDQTREIEREIEARTAATNKASLEEATNKLKDLEAKNAKILTESESTVKTTVSGVNQKLEEALVTLKDVQGKLESAEAEKNTLRGKLQETVQLSKKLGFNLKLSERLQDRADRSKIRDLVGDPVRFTTLAELDSHIDEVINTITQEDENLQRKIALERREIEREAAEKKQELAAESNDLAEIRKMLEGDAAQRRDESKKFQQKVTETVGALKEEVDQLRAEKVIVEEKFKQAMALAEELGAQAYAERKIANTPERPAIRRTLAAHRPKNRAEVDRLLAGSKKTVAESDDREFNRVRRAVTKTRVLSEEDRSTGGAEKLFGSPIAELQALAGITKPEA